MALMEEQLDFDGYWWLPANPDRRVPGRLKFSQDEIILDLLAKFDEDPCGTVRRMNELEHHEVIHGLNRDQKEITLSDCWSRGPAMRNGAILGSYSANRLLIGAWYADETDIRFDEISMRFTDLSMWAASSGFESRMRFQSEDNAGGIDVKFTPPDTVEVAIGDGATLRIGFPWTWSGYEPVTMESKITQDASFTIEFDGPASFERAQDYVYQLRNFLALGVGRPVQVVSLTGFHKPGSIEALGPVGARPLIPRKHPVEILYRLKAIPMLASKPVYPFEMLYSLGHVRDSLEQYLGRWFTCQKTLRAVFDRYFAAMFDPTPTAQDQVHRYMLTLEGHHRRTTGATAVSPEEHERRLAEVEESLSPANWAWVKPAIKHRNEPPLAARVHEIVGACPVVAERIVGEPGAWMNFARKAVTMRDYLSHLTEPLERRAPKGLSVVQLTTQLRAIAEMTLLLEIGFSCEQIDQGFVRVRRYEEVAHIKRLRAKRARVR